MQPSESDRSDWLARRWADGDDGAFGELAELSLPHLAAAAGEPAATAWLEEARSLGAHKVRYEPEAGRDFLAWALERVKLYAEDEFRPLLYAAYDGDQMALGALYRGSFNKLVSVLGSFEDDLPAGAAVDIVSDFFLDLVRDVDLGRRRYAGARGTFMAWAGKAVYNRALSMLRKTGRLAPMPEEGDALPPQLLAASKPEPAFLSWLEQALTPEQKRVFRLDVAGYDLGEIARDLGCGKGKVSKMLAEIRARVAERLAAGGYTEPLAYLLDAVRSGKGVKGLHKRLFLRFAALALVAELESDPDWAPAARASFGPDPKEALWRVNAESARAVVAVAQSLAALHLRVAAVAPGHPFCSATLRLCAEPWGTPLANALGGAALRSTAAAGSRGGFPGGGELL